MSSSTYSSSAASQVEDEEPVRVADLFRTAEASRLRRRGAITGAHRTNRQSSSSGSGVSGEVSFNGTEYQWAWPPAAQAAAPTPPWTDAGAMGTVLPAYPPWADVPDPAKAEDDADGPHGSGYALYCGSDVCELGDDEPYEPSPFPVSLDELASPAREPQRLRRSTGCGALIHAAGAPRTKSGTWQARGEATDAVVPLDKMYFECGGQLKRFACGCRSYGVGCSNWLPQLHLQFRGRKLAPPALHVKRLSRVHTTPTLSSGIPSPLPPCSSSQNVPQRRHTIHGRQPPVPPSIGTRGTNGASVQGWEGMPAAGDEAVYTYGYAEQEQEQEQEEPGAEYDPDGMLIVNEPGTPDKPSTEAMLWPAR
ncbi:hypothetical protein EW145_g6694 [Phellinidium pouzarii]|uniref:Uncharacterized protein n=1 Tax=Phellinidium pouzarii TaxID=167371 RepID=A0A4S4L097_9AGAM|nr:hypothetical protein EW145_g6694 [Phellinidium pouzarii]